MLRIGQRKKVSARLKEQRIERALREAGALERENAEQREELVLLRELEASDTIDVRRRLAELRARRANAVRP